MASVDDIVAQLLAAAGTMTTFKLQKLLYYAQGWSLAWDGRTLFDAKIRAYENGPCVGVVFNEHRGQRYVSRWPAGDANRLTSDERDTVLAVVEKYGAKTPEALVEMTHAEPPWREARHSPSDEITVAALDAYFTKLAEMSSPPDSAAKAMAGRLATFLDDAGNGDTRR